MKSLPLLRAVLFLARWIRRVVGGLRAERNQLRRENERLRRQNHELRDSALFFAEMAMGEGNTSPAAVSTDYPRGATGCASTQREEAVGVPYGK